MGVKMPLCPRVYWQLRLNYLFRISSHIRRVLPSPSACPPSDALTIDVARARLEFADDDEHFEVLSKFAHAMCTRAVKELAVKESMTMD